MNKAELIATVAKKVEMPKTAVEKVLNEILETIGNSLKKGPKVALLGFGSFLVRKRKARKARNPQTGEIIKVPATKAVVFKVGSKLKVKVAGIIKGKK
jgi:DNA-binding protein HU-beta